MEHLKKNLEIAIIIGSFSSLIGSAFFLVTLYKTDHMLTGDQLTNAYENVAAIIPTIIFSVMFGAVLTTIILSTIRLVVKERNRGKVMPTESTTNTSLPTFFSNLKLVTILVSVGIISLSISIALSVDYGGFSSVVIFGVMLGMILFSYLYIYLVIKRRKAKANEAGGNA
ncbi:MAG: hypothetical protein KJ578_14875 [Bacteroidetes bacterium]|nr:hypothetical protein [Bacteroidota bacterium]MBU1578891.1 hypothetical protein [Bacteroidota bacterium]MBU2464847.1 hypothetical protein [Bacteroidota bacterium]MBU2559060.1 hypothetical protein [Bacteroidota bacterium]